MTSRTANRTTVRVVRAALAGVLIALGIGWGAFNAWWVALFIGAPLVFIGIAIGPRPSRISELVDFRRGTDRNAVPMRVQSLTRSSLSTADLQPTLVTATVTPRDDTEYDARWITSMSRGHFQALTAQPFTTLPPDQLPARTGGEHVPEFDDQPGRWAIVYPAVTVVAAIALLFGVGQAWHVDAKLPSISNAFDFGDDETADYTTQLRNALDTVTDVFGQTGADNILSIQLYPSSSGDYATVFDPSTGKTTNIWIDAQRKSPTTDTRRKASTFTAATVAATDLTSIVAKMTRQVARFSPGAKVENLVIERPRTGDKRGPVLISASARSDDSSVDLFDLSLQALPDGTVADFFDPGDFDTAFAKAGDALRSARVSPTAPVLTDFRVRGIAGNTPTVRAGSIQNSGGVDIGFTETERRGTITIVPGQFPVVDVTQIRSTPDGFAFDDISATLFQSIRDQAMTRGEVPAYDRNSVDIMVLQSYVYDGEGDDTGEEPSDFPRRSWVITIGMADEDAADGTYTLNGRFLRADN